MRYGIFKSIQLLMKPVNNPHRSIEKACEVCGSNCGQCGNSYTQRGDGSEVAVAVLRQLAVEVKNNDR